MTAQNTPAYADNGRVDDVDPVNTLDDQDVQIEEHELDDNELDDPGEDPAEGGEDIDGFDVEDDEEE